MNALIKWYQSKNISSKSVLAAVVSAAYAYINIPPIQKLVDSLIGPHRTSAVLLAAAIVATAKFSHSTTQPDVKVIP